jgi:hypothetical protein
MGKKVNKVKAMLERDQPDDVALLRHGFTDYMRDYEVVFSFAGQELYRYHFVGCVEADCQTTLRPVDFVASLSDQFVYSGPDYPDTPDPDGFIWGVRYSNAQISYVEDGAIAARWAIALGIPMHEVEIASEAFRITLVFASLRGAKFGHADVPIPKQYPIDAVDDVA